MSISKSFFNDHDLNAVLDDTHQANVIDLRETFRKKAESAAAINDDPQKQAWGLLQAICFLHFTPESAHEPFGPVMQTSTGRSFIPDDMDDASIDTLRGVVSDIQHADLRARIADIIWLLRRDASAAAVAAEAYLEAATLLEDPERWPPSAERFERALRLAVVLNNQEFREKAVKQIEETIVRLDGTDPLYFTHRLMELLFEFGGGDADKMSAIAEKAARKAEDENGWRRARHHWQSASKWHVRRDAPDDSRDSQIKAAETHVRASEVAGGAGQNAMLAAHELERAIEAFRRIGGHKERVDVLYEELRQHQKESLKSLTQISTPSIDLTEAIVASRKHVSGFDKDETLMRLSLVTTPPDFKEHKRRAIELAQAFPLQNLMGLTRMAEDGRVVDRQEAGGVDPEVDDARLLSKVFEQLNIDYEICVVGQIEPARRQVVFEHRYTEQDILSLVTNHPLVPQGHEQLFAKGLYAGLTGDFDIAAHILIPQLENSIRHVLLSQGVETSRMDQYGIQEPMQLPELLRHTKTRETFGEDVPLLLRGLLVEKSGNNLRNRLSHGLIGDNEVFSAPSIYLWWLILRLVMAPSVARMQESEES